MKRFTKILFQGTEPLNASEFEAMNSGKSFFFENSKYKFKTEIYLFLGNLMEGFNVLFID